MLRTASYTNIGGRPRNEDSAREVRLGTEQLCTVVADGLGGHGGGEMASAAAVKAVCENWDGNADPGQIKSLFRIAHDDIVAIQTSACAMKSTIVALELDGNLAAWGHVGDSRLYHFYNGKLVFQTRDHSVSQIAVFMGEITVDQIRFHEDRNQVLRALGQDSMPTVESKAEVLAPGAHAFLLCTDGFWEYVNEPEMAADLNAAADPRDWLERMRARLLARVPADNDNNTASAVWVEIP